ncbi:MAG: hypothetical protein HY275_14140 [Gemmatimonadetes bacterium]|nr:hypothetical protein [Gemmatimonadota bacterium]
MPTFTGILHAHSTWSDGDFPLVELRDALKADGYRFVCMGDHAEYFDEARAAEYRAECARLSDASFVMVPGFEFGCLERLHIVGLGCTVPFGSQEPDAVIAHIRAHGGFSIIAHPKNEHFPWIEGFTARPHAIEVWNSKYDGRYAPRPGTFDLHARMRARDPALTTTYGVDLHFRHQNRKLHIELECDALDAPSILAAIHAGRYVGRMGEYRFVPGAPLAPSQRRAFAFRSARYLAFRRTVKTVKELLDKSGAALPPGIKAQLRRIF